ncbi:MAG: 16S rRNA (cytosine(1402)-N(4))-methyltransferase RsmH [Gammaproteobacteria bacterium]
MSALVHHPVLLREVLEGLAIKPDGVYVDATFGRGGHSTAILAKLESKGRLLAFDKDPAAIKAAATQETFKDERFLLQQGSFTMLLNSIQQQGLVGKVDGILFDLGVSSPQLDDPARGFSFLHDGPLDMRMNPAVGVSAATWLNAAPEKEIATVLKEYGEERYAKRIAKALVGERAQQPILTTGRLAEIVKRAHPRWERHKHPATRSFQAIRIFVNQELTELQIVLEQCIEALAVGGRLVVISFHSLEDRVVKRFMQGKTQQENEVLRGLPIPTVTVAPRLRRIGKLIKPTQEEIAQNLRARSAILRVAEKIV